MQLISQRSGPRELIQTRLGECAISQNNEKFSNCKGHVSYKVYSETFYYCFVSCLPDHVFDRSAVFMTTWFDGSTTSDSRFQSYRSPSHFFSFSTSGQSYRYFYERINAYILGLSLHADRSVATLQTSEGETSPVFVVTCPRHDPAGTLKDEAKPILLRISGVQ